MSKIYTGIDQIIGHTPLMELVHIEEEFGLQARLIVKLESMNPGGSAKDRVAKKMIDEAEKQGKLAKGSVIIEPTSGNTGVGLAAVAASRGYRVMIVMPETMSVERQRLIRAYGAEVILTDGAKGMTGAIEKAEALAREIPMSFLPGQFTNPANAQAHFETTGPEIYEDTDGKIDCFVAGIGTGGTISGTGAFLKQKNPNIKVIGFEPENSAVLSGGKPGKHDLQGIGAGFIPSILNRDILDEVITVSDEDSYDMARKMAQKEGILSGITSGAAVAAAVRLAKRDEYRGKTIVALLPDTGERYLSTKLYNTEDS